MQPYSLRPTVTSNIEMVTALGGLIRSPRRVPQCARLLVPIKTVVYKYRETPRQRRHSERLTCLDHENPGGVNNPPAACAHSLDNKEAALSRRHLHQHQLPTKRIVELPLQAETIDASLMSIFISVS